MNKFQFELDGVPVQDPRGWDKMIETFTRDQSLKGIFITHDATLEFTGDGYKALYAKKQAGFCSQTIINILESCNQDGYYELIYSGIIETSDCEFDLLRCICKTKINDNTFFAKINNNKSLECFLLAAKSKNGLDITPIPQYNLQLFDSMTSTGSYMESTDVSFRIYDVLKYIISFMSDDEVDFDSKLFGIGGDFQNLALSYGWVVRNINNSITPTQFKENLPNIKYQTLFQELDRRLNLGFYFDLSGAKPKIIIEKYDDTKIDSIAIDVLRIKDIFNSYFVNKLYSSVKLGTDKTITDNPALHFPLIDFIGFKDEEYNILGKCNLDNPLDLTCNFITDTNVIEQISINDPTDESYDKDWFLIDCKNFITFAMRAQESNWLQAMPPRYYNERLNNQNVCKNYLGGIPNSIASFVGSTADRFRARKPELAQGITSYGQVTFHDDFTPPNFDFGNYNASTSTYIAPTTGLYNFKYNLIIGQFANWTGTINLEIRDSGGTLKTIYSFPIIVTTTSGVQTITNNYTTLLTATDKATITMTRTSGGTVIVGGFADSFHHDSYFACDFAPFEGGIFQTYDPNDYPIEKFTFTCPLSRENHEKIKRNIIKAVSFDDGKNYFKGWIDTLKYNLNTTKADFTIISSKNFLP